MRGGEGSERRVRGTYRRGLDGHYSGEINGGVTPATVSRNGERGRRLREEGDDMRGPHGSEGREDRGYRFGAGRCWAVGSFWPWAGKASRGPFSYFSLLYFFFFFCFLNSFTDFAKMLQINSNHFQRFYKNHCKVLSQ
jgi:hypothetical protein